MPPIAADLILIFRRDLACFMREVAAFRDDATLWQILPGTRNSTGNLDELAD